MPTNSLKIVSFQSKKKQAVDRDLKQFPDFREGQLLEKSAKLNA